MTFKNVRSAATADRGEHTRESEKSRGGACLIQWSQSWLGKPRGHERLRDGGGVMAGKGRRKTSRPRAIYPGPPTDRLSGGGGRKETDIGGCRVAAVEKGSHRLFAAQLDHRGYRLHAGGAVRIRGLGSAGAALGPV